MLYTIGYITWCKACMAWTCLCVFCPPTFHRCAFSCSPGFFCHGTRTQHYERHTVMGIFFGNPVSPSRPHHHPLLPSSSSNKAALGQHMPGVIWSGSITPLACTRCTGWILVLNLAAVAKADRRTSRLEWSWRSLVWKEALGSCTKTFRINRQGNTPSYGWGAWGWNKMSTLTGHLQVREIEIGNNG